MQVIKVFIADQQGIFAHPYLQVCRSKSSPLKELTSTREACLSMLPLAGHVQWHTLLSSFGLHCKLTWQNMRQEQCMRVAAAVWQLQMRNLLVVPT
jgi:hypothetical protein